MLPSLTVFFDGGCPLCSREIAHYQRLEPGGRIRWVDITREAEEIQRHGFEHSDLMASFHVMDGDGGVHTGAAAFVLLWSCLPHYRWLAAICNTLRLIPLMEWAYGRYARWHFAKRCREGACGA